MKQICSFVEYVLLKEQGRRTSSKTGLYPLGYGGLGAYPDSDYLTHSADAVLYLTQDTRLFDNGDNHPFDITHIAGHKLWGDNINTGERDPWPIHQIPGKPVPHKGNMPSGKISPYKGVVKLVNEPKTISPKTPNFPD